MKPPKHSTANKQIDWESIEKDWRAGIKTKLQMSEEHAVSRAAIDKRFKKLGIERDLSEKIRQKAESLVTQAAVTQSVTQERLVTTEKEIVEANASMQANALLDHRKDIKRHRSLAISLLAEIEAQTVNPELFERLGEILESPDDKGVDRLNELYRKVIATPSRIDSMKKLSDTLKTLIGLEREAMGLDSAKPQTPGDALDNLLTALDGRTASLIPK